MNWMTTNWIIWGLIFMIDESALIVALESRKRLIKQDAVGNPGKYCYGVLWTDLLWLIREMTGGDEDDPKTAERC